MANVHVVFELTMPHVASWNGRWSGAASGHYLFKDYPPAAFEKKHKEKVIGEWHYSWPDGWGALIKSRVVTGDEMRKLKKSNAGFCGYSWMVDNIIWYGNPRGKEAAQ